MHEYSLSTSEGDCIASEALLSWEVVAAAVCLVGGVVGEPVIAVGGATAAELVGDFVMMTTFDASAAKLTNVSSPAVGFVVVGGCVLFGRAEGARVGDGVGAFVMHSPLQTEESLQ